MRHADRFLAPMLALATAAAPVTAAADYACQKIDVPGSTGTQIWQINDKNQVAAGSSLGGAIYDPAADPLWHAIPPPPPDSGLALAQVNALGINDAGVITGAGGPDDASWEKGFILTGSTYEFFQYGSWTHTEPRAISDGGIVTGSAWNDADSVAFVYNPGADTPDYPHGFTEVVPTLPDGTRAFQVIPGAMNSAGQFVGSANFGVNGRNVRYGFLYDPGWQQHGYAQLITLFQVEGRYTAARGINDAGQVVGFTRDASGATVGILQTAAGYQFITCPEIGGADGGIWLESINDSGVISGMWAEADGTDHGLIAYPNAVLPVTSQDGAYVFDVAVAPNTPVFLDPVAAVGYRYAVGEGDPLFASVTLPIGIGDGRYTVYVAGRAFPLAGGQRLDFTVNGFPAGVAGFTVLGIEPSAGLNPADPTAFVTGVTFAGVGRFTGSMSPMAAGDELVELLGAVTGVGPGRSLAAKVQAAQSAYAAGDVPLACSALADLVSEAAAQAGKKLDAAIAAAVAAEARDAMSAAGCR